MSKPIVHILALESSCDDTSAAVLRATVDDEVPQVLSLSVQSQNLVHQKYGGVVPELASRAHLANLIPCIRKALEEAKCDLSDIDFLSATQQPGLLGCLLIGHTAAKTLSLLKGIPFVSCHHIHSHLLSVFIEHRPAFPFLAAVVSGGHTSLYLMRDFEDFEEVGVAIDDAMGEAFDKGAKLLGLGFPGGPELDALALRGDSRRYSFGKVRTPGLRFSFSGLKSEFVRIVNREGTNLHREDLAASYQSALCDHLFEKIELGLRDFGVDRLALVGGVARNSEIRRRLETARLKGLINQWHAPSPQYCTDNAAMVGVLGFRKWKRSEFSDFSSDVYATSRPPRKKAS